MPEVDLSNPNADWRSNPVPPTELDTAKCSACGADIPGGFAWGIHPDGTDPVGDAEPTYTIEFALDQRNHLEGESK
ncbi:MAG: hypothetical protein ABIQ99_17170 [Thermoflexales bacterium]